MLPQRNFSITFCLCLFVFFIHSLEAAGPKNLEDRIKELENANSRLRQEQAMEAEASKLLGQKLLKAYEEKVVIENELKEAKEKINSLEEELARTRKLMEDEVMVYRKKIGAAQEELSNLKKQTALLTNENKVKKEKLSKREEDIIRNISEINRLKEELKPRIEAEIVSSAKVEPLVTAPARSGPVGTERGGRISSVSKEFNFVIIEFNDQTGVTVGKTFSVYRGEKKIGEVEVTKVREKYVFASIVNTTPGEEIKEGDSLP